MLNKKLLKTLLTTASAMAVMSGAATSASAADKTTNANATITENAGANTAGFIGGGAAWAAGDSVIFDAVAPRTLTTGAAGDVTIGNVSALIAGSTIDTVDNITTITNVTGDYAINATVAANSTLAFIGTDLSALGTINGDGNVTTAGDGATFANAITAGAITANGNTTFSDVVTTDAFTVAATKTATTAAVLNLGANAHAINGTLDAAAAIHFTADGTMTVGANGAIKGGQVITTAADSTGTAIFNNKVLSGAVGAIGADAKSLKVFTTSVDNSEFASDIYATTLNANGTTTFGGTLNTTTFNVAANKTATTNGTLNLTAGTITGTLNGSGAINFTADGVLTLAGAGAFKNAQAITTKTDNTGTLTLTGLVSDGDIGVIGAAGAALKVVNVNNAGANTFKSDVNAYALTTGAAATKATFNGAVNVKNLTITTGAAAVVTANGALNVSTLATIGAGTTLVVGTTDGKSAAAHLQAIDGGAANAGTVTFNSQVNALVANTSGVGKIGTGAVVSAVNVNYAGDNTFSETVATNNFTLGKGANVIAQSAVTLSNGGTLTINTGTFTANETLTTAAGGVNFAADGKLVATKAIAGNDPITTATNNTGTVEFNDVQAGASVGAIGAANKALKAVSINGAGASEFAAITAQTINVGANVVTAKLGGAVSAEALNIGGTAAVTADVALSVVKTGTTGAVNFTGDASLITTAAQTVAIDAITTNANETGTVTFAQGVVARNDAANAAAHAAVGNIGAKGAALKVLNLGNGGTLAGAVFAKDINLTGADLTVTGSVTGNLATTTARTITLTGGNFTGDIKNNGGDATLVLGDKAIFTGNVGLSNALAAEVSVAADAKASMAGNVNAAAFTLNNKAELTLNGASKINTEVPGNVGAGVTVNTVAANAATINMNGNNLEVTGFDMPATGVLNVNYGTTPSTLSMTSAFVGAGATGFNAKSTVKLSLGANPVLATAGTTYTLLDVTTSTAAGVKTADLNTFLSGKTVTLAAASNDFVTLSGLTITAKSDATGYWGKATTGRQVAAGANKIATGRADTDSIFTAFADAYGKGTTGKAEDAYFASLGNLAAADRPAAFAKISNVAPVVSAATSAVVSATEAAASAISSRVATVASGDDNRQMGAWVSGFGSMGKQGARKGDAGYKAKTAGITLGADTELSDSAVLGLAANFTNADLKLKNQLAGGKVKAKTYMVSLYGLYNISDFVISGAASVGSSKSTVNTAGTSKFSSTNFGAKATVGYKYNMSDVMLTPMAGLEFARFGKSNATETGTQRVIKIKALNKVAAILGAKVATEMSGVTPEVHAFLNYDLTNNAQKATVGLGSDATVNIATPNAKAARMSYNLGTSVSAVADDIEYGIGYDATISNKYVAHQGSIKVRLNF